MKKIQTKIDFKIGDIIELTEQGLHLIMSSWPPKLLITDISINYKRYTTIYGINLDSKTKDEISNINLLEKYYRKIGNFKNLKLAEILYG